MKLYVMRHGPAEDYAESGQDFDRALSASGRERVRSVAKELVEEDEAPLLIVTSPLVRAVQTAEIVAVATKLGDRGGTVETSRELAPGGDCRALVEALITRSAPFAAHEKAHKRVMVVGHEPDLSALVGFVLQEPMPVPMDKAMVVGLRLASSASAASAAEPHKLRFILEPKKLTWEFDAREE